ncbi:LysR family transcriptional regulator [Bradyrhizobium sp. U87765 SZCCT0131]|uniref:LysR family transcriptional regulator n=1 Tax=unclassified Bradyrhizobium TaxID=2631580 RepID=UPI001BA9A1AB|nr:MULTISPECIES: LysR family transcriptional regulator [unclassified Bradyrhizobium]MBR1219473.1 LysR family transcriptional regulator [Bradyrhizobium sp. U87765 SZCCT0131]MBR1262124.1 LysR family transcriptional regulator [Bradyrhizobium sp. U87765 SZCCT0134]MBR1308693.1 LysR family transcriptional regulator [Bradyrhizobium sp. U87765 SZCCT0110]MBR1317906.1 LysR family transcriptional regulator [Bradyrhizobium sp. U87765 SZCCT0109]MBR1351609.1 LysR family transcriptional regulator [Bradyrhizo
MHLSRIDLNLFLVFDAIYSEGGVTAAARRLNLTQPAISHALARLRQQLGDPLFTRQGRSLAPTPAARRMIGPVRQAIQSLRGTLADAGGFQPATARRGFTIGMRDLLETWLLPELATRIRTAAPHVDLAVVKVSRRELEMELSAGTIDAAVDVLLPLPHAVQRERLAGEPLAVLARRDHPRVGKRLTLPRYLGEDHVMVSARRRGQALEDLELGREGHQRNVRLRCQHYFAAARVVARSDMLCTLTTPVARILAEVLPLQLQRFPLATQPFDLFLYWHAQAEADPASQWLRRQVADAVRAATPTRP